jgi:hypothetical protein
MSDNALKQELEGVGRAFSITPSDTNELPRITRTLLIQQTGLVKVTLEHGDVVVLPLAGGIQHSLHVKKVWAGGTDTGIGLIVGGY